MELAAQARLEEVVELGVDDPEIFYSTFFPKAARQPAAKMHHELDAILDDSRYRFVNIRFPRGFSKTTRLRMATARRIAYGVSRTILYVGASEGHAVRSVAWVRNRIGRRSPKGFQYTDFAKIFGLEKGDQWSENIIEIVHTLTGETTVLMGVGITGNIRGINFEDFRPDFIIGDDIITDENAATLEQREKLTSLLTGALAQSLAPRADDPNAKMLILNTPLHPDDFSMRAEKSKLWKTLSFSCWTEETKDLPVDYQESSWPERYPSEDLREQKRQAARDNTLSVFLREMECRLVSPEATAFKPEWLQFWDKDGGKPPRGSVIISVDPVPPPSEHQIAKGLHNKDFEAIVVLQRARGNYYILDYAINRGHEPTWTCDTVFAFVLKYRPFKVIFEAIAYQRVLGSILERDFRERRVQVPLVPVTDRRPKFSRISGEIAAVARLGRLYCASTHSKFIEDFGMYPSGGVKPDLLDAVALGIRELNSPLLEFSDDDWWESSPDYSRPLKLRRAVP